MPRTLEHPGTADSGSENRSQSTIAIESGRAVLLYDGACPMCRKGTEHLLRRAKPGAIERVDFNQPGALDPFPSISRADCMQAMHFVTPDGRVFRGFEAAVRAMMTRWWWRPVVVLYYVPGIRQVCDVFYRNVAKRRHRCTDETCSV